MFYAILLKKYFSGKNEKFQGVFQVLQSSCNPEKRINKKILNTKHSCSVWATNTWWVFNLQIENTLQFTKHYFEENCVTLLPTCIFVTNSSWILNSQKLHHEIKRLRYNRKTVILLLLLKSKHSNLSLENLGHYFHVITQMKFLSILKKSFVLALQ